MKKVLLVIAVAILTSCADSKDIRVNGKLQTFQPYGWIDYDEVKCDSVKYQVCTGNVVWSIVASETIIAPVLLTGFYLYEPIGKK